MISREQIKAILEFDGSPMRCVDIAAELGEGPADVNSVLIAMNRAGELSISFDGEGIRLYRLPGTEAVQLDDDDDQDEWPKEPVEPGDDDHGQQITTEKQEEGQVENQSATTALDLTKVEEQAALGVSVRIAAEALGIKGDTLRWHIKGKSKDTAIRDAWQRGVARREAKPAATVKDPKPPKPVPSKTQAPFPIKAEVKRLLEQPSGLENIAVIENFGFNVGTAMNYLLNSNAGDPVESLEKAEWHIRREIERRKQLA